MSGSQWYFHTGIYTVVYDVLVGRRWHYLESYNRYRIICWIQKMQLGLRNEVCCLKWWHIWIWYNNIKTIFDMKCLISRRDCNISIKMSMLKICHRIPWDTFLCKNRTGHLENSNHYEKNNYQFVQLSIFYSENYNIKSG
jgi:hypothetical protein